MGKRKKERPIGTLDIETDPFLYGHTPLPFAIGFYTKDSYVQFWGDDCIERMMGYLDSLDDSYIIYVHNGGGFDFWYLQPYITSPLFFIRTRIAKCGLLGKHEMRDSYRMIPIALKDFNKESIPYEWFWPHAREQHKVEIEFYLQKDCEYLYQLVTDFISRYGMHLTLGGAAIKMLRDFHPNEHESEYFDNRFRPFYLGGRNQCFETGELKGNWKVYDVNSMYGDVMRNKEHPHGNKFTRCKTLPDSHFYYAVIEADSDGALPIKDRGVLTFPVGRNLFLACSHEIRMAEKLGMLHVRKVHQCFVFKKTQNFAAFIDFCINGKISAEENGDAAGRNFFKLFINAPYGKMGQNPRNYQDCEMFDDVEECIAHGYEPGVRMGDSIVGVRAATLNDWSFNNVAVAGSITSGSRAKLLHGLANARRGVYCDTDSIICESLDLELHDKKLGAWKTEAECDTIYIAGKKLYACYKDGQPLLVKKGKEMMEKKACKGVTLSADTIRKIALGETYRCEIDAPRLKIGHPAEFTARNIHATA